MADPAADAPDVTPLEQAIRARIRRDGPLPVSEFMRIALTDPEYGYYSKSDPLGAGGDFVTAPEISQAFGEIVGLWCAVTWQRAGRPRPVNLVELGPGRGTLMADALRAAHAVPEFADAAAVHLVETGRVLRERQRAALTAAAPHWHGRLDSVPQGPDLLIANEFFDALPVDQYVCTAAGWRRRCVGVDASSGRLAFTVDHDAEPPANAIPPAVTGAPPGSLFEYSAAACDLAGALGRRIAADGIAALVIDYGHVRPGAGETLQAVRGHRRHDVLADPGEADLTAHVDFTALGAAAARGGARCWGPVPQGAFLSALGIEARTERLAADTGPEQAALLRGGCRRLVAADGMGMLFKVLALTRSSSESPAGFETAPPALFRGPRG